MPRRFIVMSADGSGLGWAIRLQQEGEDVLFAVEPDPDEEDLDGNALVGTGLVPRTTLGEALKTLTEDDYILFDSNKLSDVSERLRSERRKVFGASALSAQMEFDRAFAVDIAHKAGLGIPQTGEFSTREDGLAFLDENLDRAYVFKPNTADERYRTTVPSREDDVSANREICGYLTHIDEAALLEGFILQERTHGVEVNFEVFLDRGTPIFATCGLETKMKLVGDLGQQVGCASDVIFAVPLTCRGIVDTVMKMVPAYGTYTGFADVNVILSDRQSWFLEVCARFGYSSHPNLFLTCAMDTFGNLMADWIDGKTQNFASRFRAGYGASINLHSDNPQRGLPLHLAARAEPFFYTYDAYKDGDDLLLAGYSKDVGVLCAHGYTVEDAANTVLDELVTRESVSYINKAFRTDLAQRNYPNAPIKRLEALTAMGYLS